MRKRIFSQLFLFYSPPPPAFHFLSQVIKSLLFSTKVSPLFLLVLFVFKTFLIISFWNCHPPVELSMMGSHSFFCQSLTAERTL